MISLLAIISGALFRRWWGGWCSPNPVVKRIIGFVLPFAACLFTFGYDSRDLLTATWIASWITFAWMMPYHGYGISMGRWLDHPLWACILVMLVQYGGVTAVTGIGWYFLRQDSAGLVYASFGALVPLIYWADNELWERLKLKPWGEYPVGNVFVDGPGAYSELGLGSVLVGGVPIAVKIATLFN